MTYPVDKIRRVDGEDEDGYTYYPVVVIGGGESGIAMGCQLKSQLRFDQFRIFERKSGIGGTWYTNTYPGVACDIPAVVYSYSWAQNSRWTAFHPSGSEILDYLQGVCRKFKILNNIQLDTNVTSIQWLDDQEQWELTLEHMAPGVGDMSSVERNKLVESYGIEKVCTRKETIRAKVVASAAGGLVEPKSYPNIPGLDSFKGAIVHAARWDYQVQTQDKNIVVVGAGCSGAQITPELIKSPHNARSVTQLLRTPPWVMPTFPPQFVTWWEAHTPTLFKWIPGLQWLVRKLIFCVMELDFRKLFGASARASRNRAAEQKKLLDHMHKMVPEKYWEILTPNYEVGCKRRVIDSEWFPSLRDPKVELSSLPLTSVTETSVTLGPGRNYPPESNTHSKVSTAERTIPCDVLVFANGYETGEWLHPLDVRGRNGISLYDVWESRGGSQAYMGTAMDGFPNLFLIFGPNIATGHSSVILASENMVNYSIRFIRSILNAEVSVFEIKESAERKWTAAVQAALRKSVFMTGGCNSWYFTERKDKGLKSGQEEGEADEDTRWNATTYPWSQVHYSLRCMQPYWWDWNVKYTRRGVIWRIVRWVFFVGCILLPVFSWLF